MAEDMSLSNMSYANSVSIYRDSLFAAANAVLANESMLGSFEDHILTSGGEGNGFGVNIKAASDKQFDYRRSFAAGAQATDATSLSYALQSGQTAANYFTDGGSVFENIAAENVKYVHGAKIQPYSLSGSGDGDLVGGIGQLMDDILVNSKDGAFGTNFRGTARDRLNYEKSFKAGWQVDDKADVSYTIETGSAKVDYFNPSTLINEAVVTNACMYKGLIRNTADGLDSAGQGRATRDSPSGFFNEIMMNYDGKSTVTQANLTTGEGTYGSRTDVPVMYVWNTFVSSNEASSRDTIAITAYNGNRNIDMRIIGRAQGLTDKYAGPLYLSPFGFIGVSKELYMSYEINR